MIFGINTISVKPGLAGAGATYLHELVTHLALVDQENEYRLFASATRREGLDADAPNFRTIAAPRARLGPLQALATEQLWLPLAVRRAGVHAFLCPTASLPWLLSQPAVVL